MKVLREGYTYRLDSMEGTNPQFLQFIEKLPGHDSMKKSPSDQQFTTVRDGTTNEEVLAVLIDRLKYLQEKLPCDENILVIENLETALYILNERTRKRQAQQVENTSNPHA